MSRAMEAVKESTKSVTGEVLILIALIGLTALVAGRFTDFSKFVGMLHQGHWWWITAGMVIHIIYFVGYAYLYKRGFAIVDVDSRTRSLVPVVFAGIFVNAVIPSGGAGAAALFIDDARRRGESGPRAAIGVVLVLLADLFTLLPFIVWGFTFLALHHKLAGYDALCAGLFAGYITVLIVMLAVAHRAPHRLERFFGWIRRVTNRIGARFHKPDLIREAWPARTANEFCNASRLILQRPGRVASLCAWAIVVHLVNIVGLWALIRAFDIVLPAGGIIAGFGMGIIFFITSPVPQGVAVVEAVMALVFASLGIPKERAITVALLFRGVNFWLPLIVGMWFVWKLRRFGEPMAAPRGD